MAVVTILGIVLFSTLVIELIMSNVEVPNYTILKSDEEIEIRRYEPMIIAQVSIESSRKETLNQGFKILADYIFGNNIPVLRDKILLKYRKKIIYPRHAVLQLLLFALLEKKDENSCTITLPLFVSLVKAEND